MLPVLPILLVQASAILLPSSSSPESQSAGCRYRKVFLHQASLLDTSPLEGWLTLDGKPCNPSSRFHWRPPVVAATVTYAPVEVSKWASAADQAVGTNGQIIRAHQKEFLKSQGLDVTQDEIREALRITTTPPLTAWTTTAAVEHVQSLPGKIDHLLKSVKEADKVMDAAPSPASAGSGRPRPASVQSVEPVAQSPAAAPMVPMSPIASQAALAPQASRREVTAAPTEAKLVPPATTAAPEVVAEVSPRSSAPVLSPARGSNTLSAEVQSKMQRIEDKIDKLGERSKRQASSARGVAKAQEPSKARGSNTLSAEVQSKMQRIEDKIDKLGERSKRQASSARGVAKAQEPSKVENVQSLRGKIDHLLKSVKEADKVMDAAASPASAASGRTRSASVESVESVAQSPAAAPPMVPILPIASQAALAPQAARGEVMAAPTEAKLVPPATTAAPEVVADVSPRSSAPVLSPVRTPLAPSTAQAPAAAVAMSPSQAPPAEVAPVAAPAEARRSNTLSAEVRSKMRQIEDKIDKLGERFKRQASSAKGVAKAQEPSKAFMNSQVAQVAKVELMDVKTDVQQEILTHALDGKAQMQGQVEAADHRRKEILQKLNATMEKRLSEARASLDDAESQVSETARHVVKEVVGNVSAEASHVAVVGTDAEKLKMEAESLQNNISALLSHVEQDSGLAAEIVAQLPSSQEVASEVEAIKADVKDIQVEAGETDELADESLLAAETAMQVLNRSDVMAQEARNLKIRAAKQAAQNRAKILEIAEIFGTK